MRAEDILEKAEAMELLPVESDHRGVSYIFDPESKRVLIMSTQGKTRRAVILPNDAVRELSEAMKVLCG